MFLYLILFCFIEKISSSPKCAIGENNCAKCHPLKNICIRCDKDIYTLNSDGICVPSKKCILGNNHCLECEPEQNLCKTCDLDYYPDENGGCSYTDNCEISYKGECLKCKNNFILIGKDQDLKICKSLNLDDFKNCEKINKDNGKCEQCKDGYNLNDGDKKCIEALDCYESFNGTCTKCNTSYYLDTIEKRCRYQVGTFFNCKITLDGKTCHECDDDYYLIGSGYCIGINYCLREAMYNKCKQCFPGYYISNYDGSCTKEEKCDIGDKKLGICTECEYGYYIDVNDAKCRSNQLNNEFIYCLKAQNNTCIKCIDGYILGADNKCSISDFCNKSENGTCVECIKNYYLGLDNLCSGVEHCIYSRYGVCYECEDNYYYNKYDKRCKYINDDDYKFKNCKYGNENEHCEYCKDNFYLNTTDYLCYDNTDITDKFYKCAIINTNNDLCDECVTNYYLGEKDNKCTSNYGCDLTESEERCLECNEYYCLDVKTGKCHYNDELNEEDKKIYFRCNRTNKEGTECEECLEGFTLSNGFCKENIHCEEEKDGICQRCHNSFSYHFCLNKNFGCMQIFYDNCWECDDDLNFNKCTKCYDGYKLNKFDVCVPIED